MAGLKGLDAASVAARQSTANEEDLKRFIGGAPVQAQAEPVPEPQRSAKKPKGPTFKRTNFSLDDKTNKQIDQLSLAPRTFKASRSDVIRAGVKALKAMPRAELIALLATVVDADASQESEQGE
ncbi:MULTISPECIES: hypothetical protein [unclassified Pseudomonas]|uniref:hypothetical protein n=1 Tax=unclassified Pseudomonas TaxID=196821 RepID=UPI000A1D9909|nr:MULTISPECIES: hypothetical protein [unclassified Pseudomonas]